MQKNWFTGGKIRPDMYCFFGRLIQTYGIVVEVSSSESGDMGSIPDFFETIAPLTFCVALSLSVH